MRKRFRIFLGYPTPQEYTSWLAQQTQTIQNAIREILKTGALKEGKLRSLHTITVCNRAESDYVSGQLTVGDTIREMVRPFRIVLEDGINDRAFLENVLSSDILTEINTHLDEGSVIFEHGGGVDSMYRTLAKIEIQRSLARFQLWVMCDHDGFHQGEVGRGSARLGNLCQSKSIPFHRLQRRCIENYLPDECLKQWSTQDRSHNLRFQQLDCIEKYLKKEQRWFYNFKKGFAQDKKDGRSDNNLFSHVKEWCMHVLDHGLGQDVGAMYHEPCAKQVRKEMETVKEFDKVGSDLLALI